MPFGVTILPLNGKLLSGQQWMKKKSDGVLMGQARTGHSHSTTKRSVRISQVKKKIVHGEL